MPASCHLPLGEFRRLPPGFCYCSSLKQNFVYRCARVRTADGGAPIDTLWPSSLLFLLQTIPSVLGAGTMEPRTKIKKPLTRTGRYKVCTGRALQTKHATIINTDALVAPEYIAEYDQNDQVWYPRRSTLVYTPSRKTPDIVHKSQTTD